MVAINDKKLRYRIRFFLTGSSCSIRKLHYENQEKLENTSIIAFTIVYLL